MSLRRLAVGDSPLSRLRPLAVEFLAGSDAYFVSFRPLSSAALARQTGAGYSPRRRDAVAGRSWEGLKPDQAMIDPWGTRGLASLSSSGSGGGKEKTSGDSEGDGSSGSKNSGGGSGKEGFDWDNFDWEKFKRYYKVAEGVRSFLKLLSTAALVAGSGSAYVISEVNKHADERVEQKIEVERTLREQFEKNAVIGHHEFVFRATTKYDALQAQFTELQTQINELWAKSVQYQMMCEDVRRLVIAMMSELHKQKSSSTNVNQDDIPQVPTPEKSSSAKVKQDDIPQVPTPEKSSLAKVKKDDIPQVPTPEDAAK